jgi:hypothetical protein
VKRGRSFFGTGGLFELFIPNPLDLFGLRQALFQTQAFGRAELLFFDIEANLVI